MGKGLDDGGGHFGTARLVVVLVPDGTGGPTDAETGLKVAAGILHELGGKTAGGFAGKARGVGGLTVGQGGADAQGTDEGSVLLVARVAMDGQLEFDGHALAHFLGDVGGSACQPVDHAGTGVEVVVVVVGLIEAAHDAAGSASPLGVVAGGLQGSGQTAGRAASRDIAHAASEADGVGGHHALAATVVGEDDAVVGIAAAVEVERAEIDPGAAAHLLVDMEGRGLAFVIDGVFGVIDALGQGLIAHIDGVAAWLGKIGLIGGFGEALAALAGLHLAG